MLVTGKKLQIRRIKVSAKPLMERNENMDCEHFPLVTAVSFWQQDRIQEEQIKVKDMILPNLRVLSFGLGDRP